MPLSIIIILLCLAYVVLGCIFAGIFFYRNGISYIDGYASFYGGIAGVFWPIYSCWLILMGFGLGIKSLVKLTIYILFNIFR